MTPNESPLPKPLETSAEILVNVLLRRLTEEKCPTGVEKT